MRTRKGGFRHLRRCNRELIAGPDFGGPVPNEPVYLPAYERYCGRFFDQLTRVSPNFWSEIRRSPVEVAFVSGLYGLLLWDELIQDYDCHLADYTRNGEERTVREIWGGVLTQAVRDLLLRVAQPDQRYAGFDGTWLALASTRDRAECCRRGLRDVE